MSGQQIFLKSVRFKGESELRYRDRLILDTYDDGYAYLASKSQHYSKMFSSPSVKRDQNGRLSTVDWYSGHAGQVQGWNATDPSNRRAAEQQIRSFLAELLERAVNMADDDARMIVHWLCVRSFDDDLLLINGHPVFTNWGIVPAGNLATVESLTAHIEHGLGPFLPETYTSESLARLILSDDEAEKEAGLSGPAVAALNGEAQQRTAVHRAAASTDERAQVAGAAAITRDLHEADKGRERKPRCWLPILIACLVAFLLLLVLLIPGVLIFPKSSLVTSMLADTALQQSEQALRARIATLKTELSERTCPAPDKLTTPAPLVQSPPPNAALNIDGNPGPTSAPSVAPEKPNAPDTEPEAPVPNQPINVVPLLEQATVLVVASDKKANMSSGSGFLIAPDKIVTNRHVIEPASKGQVVVVSKALGGTRRAQVIAKSSSSEFGDQDYALLQLLGNPASRFLTLANQSSKGQQIYAAGFPSIFMETDEHFMKLLAGLLTSAPDMVVTQGIVTVFQDSPSGNKLVLHSADISPGNSGGPLADTCGRVVGVNTFVKTSMEQQMRLNFALKTDSLLTFLSGNGVNVEASTEPCPAGSGNQQAGR